MLELIVARCDTPILFQPMKKAFNDVPAFIECLVIRPRLSATVPGRDHRHPTRRDDRLSERIRVVSLIAYHRLIRRHAFNQRRRLGDIVAIAGGQNPPQRDPVITQGQMEFRCESASSASESGCVLSAFFFGAPAAHE